MPGLAQEGGKLNTLNTDSEFRCFDNAAFKTIEIKFFKEQDRRGNFT